MNAGPWKLHLSACRRSTRPWPSWVMPQLDLIAMIPGQPWSASEAPRPTMILCIRNLWPGERGNRCAADSFKGNAHPESVTWKLRISDSYELDENSPNLRFSMSRDDDLRASVLDLRGEQRRSMIDHQPNREAQQTGPSEVTLHDRNK
jgi:hypothetical protein